MEVEANIRDKIQVEVTARGATRYNKHHNVEIFEVGVIISVGIPCEDRELKKIISDKLLRSHI